MRRQRWLSIGGVFVVNFLFFLGLGWLLGAYPAQAEQTAQVTPASNAPTAGSLQLTKSVTPAIVFNGGQITYSIYLYNASPTLSATAINLVDPLPAENWANITCSPICGRVVEEIGIPEPLGGIITITVVRQLTWTVPALAPNTGLTLTFSAQVLGQADGTVLSNIAYASYQQGGTQVNNTNPANATVRTFIPNNGQPSVARNATWFSDDFGGTISQDWGDFDRDGDVDLALGSSVGTTIYRNAAGQLDQFWTDNRRSYGVRWADVNNDKQLELIAIGNSSDGTANGVGYNYVFSRTSTGFAEATSLTFTSTRQLVRLALGDFDGDRYLDLVASTNSINATCPVLLYRNNGAGRFTNVVGTNGCVSDEATAALSVGDIDNDDKADLVLGRFPDQIIVIKLRSSSAGAIIQRTPITLEASIPFLPYDFAWGDYNNDGWLDLAAAFPLQKEVRFYRNLGSNRFNFDAALQTDTFLSPLGIDWADLNGDGWLDLVVADVGPKIYLNDQLGGFSPARVLAANAVSGQTWSIRAAQSALAGQPQIAATRRDGPSLVYPTFTGYLDQDIHAVETAIGNSVAWGDATGDGYLDLLVGAGVLNFASRLYTNKTDGTFISPPRNLGPSGLGPHKVAFGDVNRDSNLDIAIATPFGLQVYLANATNPSWSVPPVGSSNPVLAWGDANDDGALDLLVGGVDSRVLLYPNQGITLSTQPITITTQNGEVRDLAWMDYDHDYFLDFAVAYYDRPAQVYHNNGGDGTFSLDWTSPVLTNSTSVSWGDYNHDGYPDLALGAMGNSVKVFDNLTGTLNTSPAWSSPTISQTTSVAWGDWNNDGYLDLAVGNDNDLVQVYANLASRPGSPNFYWLWASRNTYVTTQLAWGDVDRDGDLDLALSQHGSGGVNGYFRNEFVRPAHLIASGSFTPTMPLPNNASYVALARPGNTKDAYFFSSGELLGDLSNSPTVTVRYRVYDPDGSRTASNLDALGPTIVNTLFEYSLDGGSTWLPATPAISNPVAITQTSRLGRDGTFIWNAAGDRAISNDARFRVTTIINDGSGPLQRAGTIAVSPPFRLRATTCTWPTNPSISVTTTNPAPGQNIRFQGALQGGSGVLTFTWNFGDGATSTGQTVYHTYTLGIYTARLTVRGQPCPENRDVTASVVMYVGVSPNSTWKNYLAFIRRGSSALAAVTISKPTSLNPEAANTTLAPTPPPVLVINPALSSPLAEIPPTGPTGLPIGAPAQPTFLQPNASITFITVTNSTIGFNNAPAIDDDGTRVVFWSTADLVGNNSDGNIELFLADMATTTVSSTVNFVQLTNSTGSILGGFNLGPSISANGEWVSFFSDRNLTGYNSDGNFEVFVANVSPNNLVTLTQVTSSTGGFNILPSLAQSATSTAARYVAFISDRNYAGANTDGNSELFYATLTTSGTISYTQVTSTTAGTIDQPVMNGDGSEIAFLSDQTALGLNGFNPDGNREVFLARILTSTGDITITQVTSTSFTTLNTQPYISNNGNRLAFVSNQRPYTADINLNGVAIGPGLPITGEQPSLSFDGSRMAFLTAGKREISLYDLVYNKVLTLAAPSPTGDIFSPRISGDGTQIVLANNRQIYLAAYPYAEISVRKIASPPPIYPGMDLVYTLTVTNNGPSIATTVTLTDTLPPSVFPPTFTPANCTNPSTTKIQCNLGDIPPRQSQVLTIGVTLPNTYFVTFTNTVIITATSNELFTDDNQAAISVTIGARPITSVVINTALTTTVYVTEPVQAVVGPVSASLPISYAWTTTGPTLGPSTINNNNISGTTNSVNYHWLTGGYYSITVLARNPANALSTTRAITVYNLAPTISAYSPITRLANGPAFTLNLTGTNYVLSSTLMWNGSPRTTNFVTATRLQVNIGAGDLITAGYYTLTVNNPAPGGGEASPVTITVENPVPQLTAITPDSVTVNSPSQVITLTGSNFTVQSVARWDSGTHLPTYFVNSTSLTASVTNTLLTLASAHAIDILNPAPAGGTSVTRPFTVNNPAPTLNQIIPISITAGSPSKLITVTGSNFFVGAHIHWDGIEVATSFISSTQLQATISASLLIPNTPVTVWVDNPAPNLGTSNSLIFTRDPLYLWFTPDLVPLEVYSDSQKTFTARINAVQANPTGITLTRANSLITTVAVITIPAGLTQTNFNATVGLINGYTSFTGTLPANVGGLTNTALITVNNPYPILTAISPTFGTVGGYTFTLNLNDGHVTTTRGSFVANSQVSWQGNILASTLMNSRTLSVTVPYTFLDLPLPYGLSIFNPAPGGGNTITQTIQLTYPTISLAPTPLFLNRATAGVLTLALNTRLAQDTAITVTTANSNIAQITSTVMLIPAGSLTTTFVVSNPVVGGTGGTTLVTAVLSPAIGSAQAAVQVNVIDMVLSPAPTATLVLNANTLNATGTLTLTRFPAPTGSPLPITLASSNNAVATVPASIFVPVGFTSTTFVYTSTQAGTAIITATDNITGGPYVATTLVAVYNPQPQITAITPATITAGSPEITITISGQNFVAPAVITYAGQSISANFISPTQLTATLTAANLIPSGPTSVTVANPAPAVLPSNAWVFTRTALGVQVTPITTSLNIPVASEVTLTVAINAIQATTTVVTLTSSNNGIVSVPSTVEIPPGQLNAKALASIGAGPFATVTASLSPTLGGLTNTAQISIEGPILTAVSPIAGVVYANPDPLSVLLQGSNFISTSQVFWNGQLVASIWNEELGTFTADIPVLSRTVAGPNTIIAYNPAPGGGASLTQTVMLTYPTITLNPPLLSVPKNKSDLMTVTINPPLGVAAVINLNITGNWNAPASVTVPAGGSGSASFTIGRPSNGAAMASITATLPMTLGSGQASAGLGSVDITLNPTTGVTLTLSPITLQANTTLTLTRDPKASGTVPIVLTPTSPIVQVPSVVNLFNNDTQVTFGLTSTLAGSAWLTATDNSAGGPYTDSIPVYVYNPVPSITGVVSSTLPAGVPAQTITLLGQGFVTGAVAYMDGIQLATGMVTSRSITATIPPTPLGFIHTGAITVVNPLAFGASVTWPLTITPLGLTLTPPTLNLSAPLPSVIFLTATVSAEQDASRSITLNSANSLLAGVLANVVLPANTLSISFPVTLTSAGSVSINGTLPAPLGALTDTALVTIPGAILIDVSPDTETLGGITTTLTLTGSGFLSDAVASWDGTPLTTFYVSANTVTATLPPAQHLGLGAHLVRVHNPTEGTYPSLAQTVVLTYPTIGLFPNPLYAPKNSSRTMTVTLNTPLSANTQVTLVTVPNNTWTASPSVVTIPANNTNATFTINRDNDGGSPSAILTATLTGTLGTRIAVAPLQPVDVILSPTAQVNLTLDVNTLRVTRTLTVTRAPTPGSNLDIDITSSNGSIAQVPAVVTILGGNAFRTFVMTGTLAGTAWVTATDNVSSGGPYTDAITVTVNNPTPTISTVVPSNTFAGVPTQTITITGLGYVTGASVYLDGSLLSIAGMTSRTITATIPPALLIPARTASITITNQAPSAGPSVVRPFTVTALGLTLTPAAQTVTTSTLPTVISLTATLSAAQNLPTVMTLTSSNGAVASVPSSINIPAGVTSISVPVTLTVNGAASITGTLPLPLGGITDTSQITVAGAILTSVSPVTGTVGGITMTLTLNGTGFVSGIQAFWNGTAVGTTFGSATLATATISSTLLTAPGPYPVVVQNPGTAPSLAQTVTLTYPTISLSPSPLFAARNTGQTMTATLSAPLANSTVVTLTLVPSTNWAVPSTVTIPSNDVDVTFVITRDNVLGSPAATITATLPGPLGGDTGSATLQPVDLTFSPTTQVSVTLSAATLSVTRTQTLTRTPAPTSNLNVLISSTNTSIAQVLSPVVIISGTTTRSFVITSTLAGTAWVTATDNVSSGGPYTDAITITVNNPAPNITGVVPSNIPVGVPTQTITITGQGFVTGAIAYLNGQSLNTTIVSSRTITAIVPVNLLTPTYSANITVTNIAPVVGASNPLSFNVTPLGITLVPSSFAFGNPNPAPPPNFTVTVQLSAPQYLNTPIAISVSNPSVLIVSPSITLLANSPVTVLTVTFAMTNPPPGGYVITATLPAAVGGMTSTVNVTVNAGLLLFSVSAPPQPNMVGASPHPTLQILFTDKRHYKAVPPPLAIRSSQPSQIKRSLLFAP